MFWKKLVAAASLAVLASCTPVDQSSPPSTTDAPTVSSAPSETVVEPTPTTTAPEPTTTVIPGPTTTTVVPTPTVTAQPPTTVIVPPPVTVTPTPTTTTVVPAPPVTGRVYPKHTGIVATTFWVGEIFDPKIPDGSQVCSAYDSQWAAHWSGAKSTGVAGSGTDCEGSPIGGCDGIPGAKGTCSTEARKADNGYFPTSSKVTPKENPFYLDLPYDDMNDDVGFKDRCVNIPWAKDDPAHCKDTKNSYMKNRWVKITGPNKHVCYGQNEDAGPSSGSNYHDSKYVFGLNDARPANAKFGGAGMDVSPALNGCLGFKDLDGDTDKVDWEFVDRQDVPTGPWTKVETISGFTE